MKKLLTIFFLSSFIVVFPQKAFIDSLKTALKNVKSDTSRCNVLSLLAENAEEEEWPAYNEQLLKLAERNAKISNGPQKRFYLLHYANALKNSGLLLRRSGDIKGALEFYNRSLKIQEEIDDKIGMSNTLNNIARVYFKQGDVNKAMEFFEKGLKISESIKDKDSESMILINIGAIYQERGEIEKALTAYEKSLQIKTELGDKSGMSYALNSIGGIHRNLKEFDRALEYFQKALALREEVKDKVGIAASLANIGSVFASKNDNLKAISYYEKSLAIGEALANKREVGTLCSYLGNSYTRMDQLDKAMPYYKKALQIFEEMNEKQGIAELNIEIGLVYLKKNNLPEAFKHVNKGFLISKGLGYPENIKTAALYLSEIYLKQNKGMDAYAMYKLSIQMRDSVNNIKTQKAAIEQQAKLKYETEKALADAVHKAEIKRNEEVAAGEKKRQNIILLSVSMGLLLVIIFSGFIYNRFKVTRRQNVVIEEQKHLLEDKQKEILDSIHYAKRIQRALLATETYINRSISRLRK